MPDGEKEDNKWINLPEIAPRRSIDQIPCFRRTFLFGIGGGIGVGLSYFMFTSNAKKASFIGYGSFVGISVLTWAHCRYNWTMERQRLRKMRRGVQEKILYENTDVEKEIQQKTKDL